MQFQTLPDSSAFLTFEDIVPSATSNSHVASAALYHCLGTISPSYHVRQLLDGFPAVNLLRLCHLN